MSTTTSKDSVYRRPYKSRRRRDATKLDGKKKDGRLLLRILIAMVIILIATLTLIVKDVGKSQMAADPSTLGAR